MSVKVKRVTVEEIDIPDLPARLREARERSMSLTGRSLTEIARQAGISRNYWYQIEADRVPTGVSLDVILRIEEALGESLGVSFNK